MHEVTNADRADFALTALEAFAAQTGQLKSGQWDEDMQTVVQDLLCDLMHYCGQNNIDFALTLKGALGCYKEEQEEEE
jgi:hypothetical protein